MLLWEWNDEKERGHGALAPVVSARGMRRGGAAFRSSGGSRSSPLDVVRSRADPRPSPWSLESSFSVDHRHMLPPVRSRPEDLAPAHALPVKENDEGTLTPMS